MESECFTVRIEDPEGRETKVRIIFVGKAALLILVKDRGITFLLSSDENVGTYPRYRMRFHDGHHPYKGGRHHGRRFEQLCRFTTIRLPIPVGLSRESS